MASLGGCAAMADMEREAKAGDAPVEADSMLAECPWQLRYAPVLPPGTQQEAQKKIVEARLAARGLHALWEHERAAPFTDTAEDRQRLETLVSIVLPALERYPVSLFTAIALRDIVLVKDLRVSGQRRRAMPDPGRSAMVYADNGGALCPAGMEMRVHHELSHFIDFRIIGDYYFRDPAWLALNSMPIDYGRGGATAYGTQFQNLGHPSPGLVSRYAAYGVEEDKAEVFGWMMTPVYAARIVEWAAADATLDAKRRFVIDRLRDQSGGRMNAEFFDQLGRDAAPR
jgi:hypothetical protein